LKIHVWDHVLGNRYKRGVSIADNEEIETFCGRLWFDYYKKPLDTLGVDWIKVHTLLRKGFFQADYPDQIPI